MRISDWSSDVCSSDLYSQIGRSAMLARQAAAAARRRAAGRPRKARAERVAIKKGGIPRSFTRKSHVSRERSGHHRARISRRDIVEQRFVGAESSRCLCPPLPLAGGETEAAATGATP